MSTNGELSAMPIGIDTPWNESGLTKREHFAGLAMQGMISRGSLMSAEDVSYRSVVWAEALLKELLKREVV